MATALASIRLPDWWVALVDQCLHDAGRKPLVHGVEYFSGYGELSKAFRAFVGPYASYDIDHGDDFDITTDTGMRMAVMLLLRVGGKRICTLWNPLPILGCAVQVVYKEVSFQTCWAGRK